MGKTQRLINLLPLYLSTVRLRMSMGFSRSAAWLMFATTLSPAFLPGTSVRADDQLEEVECKLGIDSIYLQRAASTPTSTFLIGWLYQESKERTILLLGGYGSTSHRALRTKLMAHLGATTDPQKIVWAGELEFKGSTLVAVNETSGEWASISKAYRLKNIPTQNENRYLLDFIELLNRSSYCISTEKSRQLDSAFTPKSPAKLTPWRVATDLAQGTKGTDHLHTIKGNPRHELGSAVTTVVGLGEFLFKPTSITKKIYQKFKKMPPLILNGINTIRSFSQLIKEDQAYGYLTEQQKKSDDARFKIATRSVEMLACLTGDNLTGDKQTSAEIKTAVMGGELAWLEEKLKTLKSLESLEAFFEELAEPGDQEKALSIIEAIKDFNIFKGLGSDGYFSETPWNYIDIIDVTRPQPIEPPPTDEPESDVAKLDDPQP